MPLTPVTAALFDPAYVQRQWSVLGSRLAPTGPPTDTPPAGPECSARPGAPLTSIHYTLHYNAFPYISPYTHKPCYRLCCTGSARLMLPQSRRRDAVLLLARQW